MKVKKIGICIPTYDRVSDLDMVLRVLYEQSAYTIADIYVIDNASPEPLNKTSFYLSHYPLCFNYICNRGNIGLAGNITKCFEISDNPWTWILGDDDIPTEDAINTILNGINHIENNQPDCVWIKFGCRYGGGENMHSCADVNQLCEYAIVDENFSNLLFISTTVVKTTIYLQNLQTSHNYEYTLAPHLAVLLKIMNENHGSFAYFPDIIVVPIKKDEQRWLPSELIPNIFTVIQVADYPQVRALLFKVYPTHRIAYTRWVLKRMILADDSSSRLVVLSNYIARNQYSHICYMGVIVTILAVLNKFNLFWVILRKIIK